jgi:hypothetical protein
MNEQVCLKIKNYLKSHVKKVVETCGADNNYTWTHWREYVDPLLDLSNAMGVDCLELQRAKDSYTNAQTHLLHEKQALILKLQSLNMDKITESDSLT